MTKQIESKFTYLVSWVSGNWLTYPSARVLDSLTRAVYSFGRAFAKRTMAYQDPFLFLLIPVPQQPIITRLLFTQQGLTIATARRETLERMAQNRQH